jgi:hypothetical protein
MNGAHDMSTIIERPGLRFIPGPFQYSGGVAASEGFRIERVRFSKTVDLAEGFARIAAYLGERNLPLTSFCACELRSPGQFTEAGFTAFNRRYLGTLEQWGIVADDVNPVARSNVCPEIAPPSAPGFHAFCHVVPCPDAPPSFVISGSGEARNPPGPYPERIIRYGETSPDALREKADFTHGQLEGRMAALGTGWGAVTATQVYCVHDIYPFLASDIIKRGAAPHGITWHYCRPPVVGLEYEMDCRGVPVEHVLMG